MMMNQSVINSGKKADIKNFDIDTKPSPGVRKRRRKIIKKAR